MLKDFGGANPEGVAGFFNPIDQRNHAIVPTNDGKAHELWWQPGQPGIEGQTVLAEYDDLITGIAGFFSQNDQRYHAIVGTTRGKVHELWWQTGQAQIEGQGLLSEFPSGPKVWGGYMAGFYADNDPPQYVIVAINEEYFTLDGKVYVLRQSLS